MPLWICKLHARINFLACSRQKPGKTEKERSVFLGQSLSSSLSQSLLLPKGVDSAPPSFHSPLFTHTRHLFQLHSLHQLSCSSGIFLMFFNSLIGHKMRRFSGGSYFSCSSPRKKTPARDQQMPKSTCMARENCKEPQLCIWNVPQLIRAPITHKIVEFPELEGTYKDQVRVQLLALHRTALRTTPCYLRCCPHTSWTLSGWRCEHFPGEPVPVTNHTWVKKLYLL